MGYARCQVSDEKLMHCSHSCHYLSTWNSRMYNIVHTDFTISVPQTVVLEKYYLDDVCYMFHWLILETAH